jgi:hypothetical protein
VSSTHFNISLQGAVARSRVCIYEDNIEHHSVPLPPLLGVVGIIGGGALFYFGAKEGR